jgi:ABC-2 type transport system permease protein
VTLIIPIALLVFFASARVLPATGRTMTFLLPGTATLAVISTGLVSLGIATAYERHYGILKLLGATPFPRAGLIAAKVLTVLLLEILQLALLVAIAALFYGWRPSGSPALAVLALLLGSVCFAGLGLAMAGSLRAESTLAAANGLFLLFLLLGGLYVPIDHLPGWIVPVARVLPASVLANSVRSALAAGRTLSSDSILLVAWAIAATVMAARTFRWE